MREKRTIIREKERKYNEGKRLKKYKVKRYVPSKEVLEKYKDGGVAIIDQWICAHGRSVFLLVNIHVIRIC